MTCRETPAGSAFTSFARITAAYTGEPRLVSDAQCLSLLHGGQREYEMLTEQGRYTGVSEQNVEEVYRRTVRDQAAAVATSNDLTEARRESILERLDRALAGGVPLDRDGRPNLALVYSLQHINRSTRHQHRRNYNLLRQHTRRTGIPFDDVVSAFNEHQANAPSRGNGADFPADVVEAVGHRYGTQERSARHAAMRLEEEARALELARVASRPPAVTREVVTGNARYTGIDGLEVHSFGYNSTSRRLEVELSDGSVHAYAVPYWRERDVRQACGISQISEMSAEFGTFWANEIRGNSDFTYSDKHAQRLEGAAARCRACGQFVQATGNAQHGCPPPAERTMLGGDHRRSSQRVSMPVLGDDGEPTGEMTDLRVQLPLVREMRAAANTEEGVAFYVDSPVTGPSVSGADNTLNRGVALARRNENGELNIDISDVQCYCQSADMNYQFTGTAPCPHRRALEEAIRDRIDPPARRPMTEEERERRAAERQAAYEAAAADDWTRQEETLAEARKTWQESETLYSDDPAAFLEDWRAAENQAAKNGSDFTPVSYQRENALKGLGTRESGDGFGAEIEFTFPPDVNQYQALQAIGKDLYEAGITSSERQRGYGASKRDGYRDTHTDPETGKGTWSFEQDSTVSGEIVTPVMFDEPETWEKLEKACTILKSHGAIASTKAGMHVHVGTGSYGGNVGKYTELARMVSQHEDVLYRAGANPQRGKHRGYTWSAPHNRAVPPEGFSTVTAGWASEGTSATMWQGGRYKTLNFAGVKGEQSDHPEFRLFDSSLDPGTMQVQIKTALGMAAAASRVENAGGTERNPEPVGSHKKRRGRSRRRLSDSELLEDTATMRSFVDTIFHDPEDKKQFLEVFSRNKWAPAPRR
jgi:hypothetical protein